MKNILATPLACLLAAVSLQAFPFTVTDTDYGIEFTQSFSRAFESDLRPSNMGDLTVDRARTELSYDHPWMEGYFEISTVYEHSDYDFSGTAGTLGGANLWGIDFAVLQHIDGAWSAVGRLGLEFAKEQDADFDESFLFSIMGGAAYQFSDDFSITLGIFYAKEFETDNLILPFVALDWQVTENFRLRTANGVFGTYDVFGDKQTLIKGKVEYDRRQFRLDKAGSVGANAAIDESGWEAGIAVRQYLFDTFYLEPYVEAVFARELTVYQNHRKVSDTEVDAGMQAGISGGFVF